MDEDKFYDNIQKALENLPDNFNILEEQIDMEVQLKYFEFSNNVRSAALSEECLKNRNELFEPKTTVDRKKEILSAIAAVDDVAAYRTIEKFLKTADTETRQWAVLALQESRMLLQSSLLNEEQVFISTGLGGKGHKLRYFVVFINQETSSVLNATQRKVVKNELNFELDRQEGELEVMDFMKGFSTAQLMLPIKANIKKIFRDIIDESNQFGSFLNENYLVTNVKVLSRDEILEIINNSKNRNIDDLEEE